MRAWAFHDAQLAQALAAWEARRQAEGASEQQAKDDTQTIVQFLASPEALEAKMVLQVPGRRS